MPRVRLISGATRSGRAQRIDSLLLESLDESLLLVPSGAYARRRAVGILDKSGRAALLDPPVITLGELAERILAGAGLRIQRSTPLHQRVLLERAIARARAAGSLDSIGSSADSEGFVDHLLHVIGQLKQAAIEPKQFRQRVRARRNATDALVAEVYGAYQDELQRAGVVDLPGLYWLARIECEKTERPRALRAVRHLLLDDFDDFTPSEFGVVQALARHLDQLSFGINVSADPEQRTLYATPLRTQAKIRDAFEAVDLDDPLPEPAPRRRSEFVAASLLVRKELGPPPALTDDLEFVECHTLTHEIETLARRIKSLVRDEGVPLPRIAVVWRNPAVAAAPMREIFREFGVPLAGLETRTLAESAFAGFLLRLLDTAQRWSLDAVLDVLCSPWFAGPRAPHAGAFPILARAARATPSPGGWIEALARLRRFLDDPGQLELKELNAHLPGAPAACDALIEALRRLVRLTNSIPRSAPPAAHLAALEAIVDGLPWPAAIAAMPESDEQTLEEAAAPELRRVLASLRSASARDEAKISSSAFIQMLRRTLALTPLSLASPLGAANVLGMEPARYLEFDYVFLAGQTDDQVPAARRTNAIYSDEDRGDLHAAGIPLEAASAHSEREILLFQRMFSIARRRLIVSWHRLAPAETPVQRSLYLNEIADRLGGLNERCPRASLDALVPDPARAGCQRDVQNLAVLTDQASIRFPALAAAAAIEKRRYSTQPFDTHDGQLQSGDLIEALAERFGPDHVFSASQLESYADCPFRFFQERVLGLFAIEPPEQVFDHLARGSVLHAALESFHRRFVGTPIPELDEPEAARAMRECAHEAFDTVAARLRNLSPGLLAAERDRCAAALQRHLQIQRGQANANSERWAPEFFELNFDDADRAAEVPAFIFQTAAGPLRLRGRIDRVDRCGDSLRLVDYKSSKVEPKAIKEKKTFQLALYAAIAESALFPGQRCESAIYLPVGIDDKPTTALDRSDPKASWDDRIALASEAAAEAVAGIRQGRFHPALDKDPCDRCPAQKVCRFERARIQRKAERCTKA